MNNSVINLTNIQHINNHKTILDKRLYYIVRLVRKIRTLRLEDADV